MWPYYQGYTAADTELRMRVGAVLIMERGQEVLCSYSAHYISHCLFVAFHIHQHSSAALRAALPLSHHA
ncbi:hypothetical protein ATANTOWER_027195 [Ataeniobius toweri]|uniref:Uncharacterized protein n=1 Tax=Ataeniobius toweri TaxID=208326 RepID=A0ABU7BLT7_9TELE|nr:hypothetical protein [Ataeniobius toweri]